tara:strand:+ start:2719 stop:4698 length:1980 start_codon:yes stop_codon:yes gene_type:complete
MGNATKENEILFNVPWMGGNESEYLNQVLRSNHFAGNGDFSKRCQKLLEEKFGVKHVLLTTSCTAALELSAMAFDIGFGDEVIVPSYTFAATASAFHRNGARVIFAEINPDTLMIDPNDVKEKITQRTKAIVPVHYGGFSADMNQILEICQEEDIFLIEDAAQGLGSTGMGSRWLGTIGSLGCISFHETKNIHSGLGGALLVNEEGIFDRIEDIWERGTNRTKMFKGLVDKYSWVEAGSSFYPTELQSAFLLSQLESIDENLRVRGFLADAYFERLQDLQSRGLLSLQKFDDSEKWNSHAIVTIQNSIQLSDKLRVFLKSKGINAYIGYVPLHSSRMGQRLGWSAEDLPITEEFAYRVLRLPLHHMMDVQDVGIICDEVESFLTNEDSLEVASIYPEKSPLEEKYLPNYFEELEIFRSTLSRFHNDDQEHRIEHFFECLRDRNIFHDIEEVKEWFSKKRDRCRMVVTEIPLNECSKWSTDPSTGNSAHESGQFFRIHGIRVDFDDREVGRGGWDQPILTQVGFDGGVLGLLRQRFNGIPHYLVEAKAEPGNYGKLQISPTLQATVSNLDKAHGGNSPRFMEYFINIQKMGFHVIFDQWLSEDGGRLNLKRNRGMLVEVPEGTISDIPENFIWLSMWQIKQLLNEDAWINPHIRGIISHL